MTWEKILEQREEEDSPTFIAYQDDDYVEDFKLVIKTIKPNKKHTIYLDQRDMEEFLEFIDRIGWAKKPN